MKFSIIHPTARVDAAQPGFWGHALRSVFEGCDSPAEVEYILVVHESRVGDSWDSMSDEFGSWLPTCGRFTVVTNYGRDCIVDQCNAGLLAASGDILISTQDDMRFPPRWDSQIAALIPDASRLIAVQARNNNVRSDLLNIPSICTRALQYAIGPISPEYISMCLDDEWSAQARKLGTIISAPHVYFEHLHPTNGGAQMDSVYEMENSGQAYRVGREVFARRQSQGFPRVELPEFAHWKTSAAAAPSRGLISVCTPGESHRAEWSREYGQAVFALANDGWDVRPHWDYSTNVYHTRMSITKDVIAQAEGGEPKYVLWIDDDNPPNVEVIRRLIYDLEAREDLAGVAAWCWIKTRAERGGQMVPVSLVSCGQFQGDSMMLTPIKLTHLYADRGTLKSIEWSGFPCLLVRYEVVKALGPLAFQPIYDDELDFGFSGEDSAWFRCATAAGYKFAVDPMCKVDHLKFGPYEPDYVIHENCPPEKRAAIQQARAAANGEPVHMTGETKRIMEASKV